MATVPLSPLAAVRYILFDAVGTLIYPRPAAAEAYQAIGAQRGIDLPRDEIAARFRSALHANTQDGDRPTSEAREENRWRRIVADVFRASESQNEELFQALWRHFSDPGNWVAYDDSEPTWRELEQRGLPLGVASNFDGRIVGIARSIGWLCDCPRLFYSSLVGFSKPNREFFASIAARLEAAPHELLLVGDDLHNDYLAARAAGWSALWLDRSKSSVANDASVGEGERIGSLEDLAKLFRSA